MEDRRPLKALCFSDKCCGTVKYNAGRGEIKTNVTRSTEYCPDCNHAIYWSRGERRTGEKHYATSNIWARNQEHQTLKLRRI